MKTMQERSFSTLRMPTLMLLATCASPMLQAQDAGWYGTVNLGKTGTEFRDADMISALQGAGYSVRTLGTDDDENGWKLGGGYSFNSQLAVEASYADLGDFSALAALLPPGQQVAEASLRGVAIDLVGSLPLSTRFSAFGRIGLNHMRINQDFSNPALGAYFANETARGTHEKYGIGVEYRITNNFAVRTEYERFRLDDNRVADDHADMVSLGLVYRFGRRAAAPAPVAATPAPTPAPQPQPQPQPAPPVRITLAAHALFDFDRSELKPEGRAELDALVRDLEGLDYEVILVTGHTDRIGTRNYNLALSERRANTVREYLVGAGVPTGVITARGVNSDDPVTTPQQCTGPVSDALKACLQPDRRVEVEVSGIRDDE